MRGSRTRARRELAGKELVKVAAAKPGELNSYAVPGSPYLSWLAFQKRAGISTVFVPYKGPAAALGDLSEGRIHVMITSFASVRGLAQSEKIKVLAVTNATRTAAAPDVETVAEAGYPDFTFGRLPRSVWSAGHGSSAAAARISSETRDILKDLDVQKRLTNLGLLPRGTTPAEFGSIIDEQRAKWAAIARAHDIKSKRQ